MKKTKLLNPICAYGLIILSFGWVIAAAIIAFNDQNKSFLIVSFLMILGLLCAICGVIIAAQLLPVLNRVDEGINEQDYRIANLITLSSLSGYVIPLGSFLIPFWLWRNHYRKSKFIHDSGYYVVNFQLAIALFVATALMLCPLMIGFILLPVIIIAHLIFVFVGISKTRQKQVYIYPGNLKFFSQKIHLGT